MPPTIIVTVGMLLLLFDEVVLPLLVLDEDEQAAMAKVLAVAAAASATRGNLRNMDVLLNCRVDGLVKRTAKAQMLAASVCTCGRQARSRRSSRPISHS